MRSKRIEYIDLAKGLCIILVVLYHVCVHLHYMPQYVKSLSVFRMPLYFFLSGLFFKEYEGFVGFFLRKVNKLFIPFAFFYLVTSFALSNILHLFGFTVAHTQSLGVSGLWAFIAKEEFANNPIWFLWCLFLVNIYFYIVLVVGKRVTANNNYLAILVSVVCIAIGIFSSAVLSRTYDFPGFTDSAMSALPFFSMGYLFNRYTDILVPNKIDKYLPIITVACLALTFLIGGNCNYKLNEYSVPPVLQYICGMTGTLGVIFLAKMLHSLPLITYFGRYSIMILCTHGLLLQVLIPLLRKINLPIPLNAAIALIIVMCSYELIIPLMKRFLPHVTAQKDVINISKLR